MQVFIKMVLRRECFQHFDVATFQITNSDCSTLFSVIGLPVEPIFTRISGIFAYLQPKMCQNITELANLMFQGIAGGEFESAILFSVVCLVFEPILARISRTGSDLHRKTSPNITFFNILMFQKSEF